MIVAEAAASVFQNRRKRRRRRTRKRRSSSPALVEGVYLDAVVCVLLQDLLGVLVRIEGIHEDQGHVGVVRFVQVLPVKKKKIMKRGKKLQSDW